MDEHFQLRRISKPRADELKKNGSLGSSLLLNTFNGFLIIEPAESGLGDGDILPREEADYELQPVWHLGPKTLLHKARERLGLATEIEAGQMSRSGT